MKLFILLCNIFIIIFITSCSKSKKEIKVFELNKNIEFNLDNKDLLNSKEEIRNILYDFLIQKDIIKYSVNSFQLFTSKYNQILMMIKFKINFKKIKEEDGGFIYKIYFTDFELKHKLYYGYFDFELVNKKYNLIMNALYFNIVIDNYGKKIFDIESKVSFNPSLKSMSGFIFNIINYIFLELPKSKIVDNNFIFTNKKYELTDLKDEDGSILLKYDNSEKNNIDIEPLKDYLILKSDNKNSKIRILYSKKDKIPEKINLLFENGDKLKFEDKEYTYSVKNYYFIHKIK